MSQRTEPYDRHGSKNPKWRGGFTVERSGRVLIYSPNHPFPNWKNYVYRYRLVLEKKLGRYLRKDELVHHRNGKNNDDRISNLEIVNRAEHARIHGLKQIPPGFWSMLHRCCLSCKTTAIRHKAKGLCEKCYEKQRP